MEDCTCLCGGPSASGRRGPTPRCSLAASVPRYPPAASPPRQHLEAPGVVSCGARLHGIGWGGVGADTPAHCNTRLRQKKLTILNGADPGTSICTRGETSIQPRNLARTQHRIIPSSSAAASLSTPTAVDATGEAAAATTPPGSSSAAPTPAPTERVEGIARLVWSNLVVNVQSGIAAKSDSTE